MGAEKRRDARHRCNFNVEIHFDGARCGARVIDLSETGMCVSAEQGLRVRPGEDVEVYSDELGYLSGKARWRQPDRLGIEFRLSSNTRAKLKAYQKYFKESQEAAAAAPGAR
jgi:hypothetical protein